MLLKKTVDSLKNPDNIRRYFEASQRSSQGEVIQEEEVENGESPQHPLHIEINSGNFSPATALEK